MTNGKKLLTLLLAGNNEPNTEEGKNKLTLYRVGFEPTSFKTDIPSWLCGSVGRAMGDLFKGRTLPRPDIFFSFSLSLFWFHVSCFGSNVSYYLLFVSLNEEILKTCS